MLAAVQHGAGHAGARELVGGEETRGTIADDDHAARARDLARQWRAQLVRVRLTEAEQHVKAHPTTSRVDGAPPNHDLGQLFYGARELARDTAPQRLRRVGLVETEVELQLVRQRRLGQGGPNVAPWRRSAPPRVEARPQRAPQRTRALMSSRPSNSTPSAWHTRL